MDHRQLIGRGPVQALLGPGREPQGGFESKFGSSGALFAARLSDVEPLLLPPFDGLHEGTFGPWDVGQLAHHSASALCMLTAHHFRLYIEDLQPQSEVGWDAEEGLAHDNECRDVEDRVGGQIVEVQPVVKQQSADKRVERESQPADEMGEKYNPLLGLWGGRSVPWLEVDERCPWPGTRPPGVS